MIGRRHHLLSLVAAALALALGLGLGAGPVAEDAAADHARTVVRSQDRAERLAAHVDELTAQAAAHAEVLAALAAPLTARRLDGRTVLVVATPGSRRGLVRRVVSVLEESGAGVTGVLRLTPTYVDPARAESPLEDLALRLVPPGVQFADRATPIERVGTVLARSIVQVPKGRAGRRGAIDQDAAEVIAGLDELDALRLDGDPGRRAELAVVVSNPAGDAGAEPALTGLLAALDAGSRGAVLAGPGEGDAGALRWVRDAPALEGVSTVDSADVRAGLVALVLALAEQMDGGAGHYGLGRGASRVLPPVPPAG